jgi:hypothetical protein
MKEPLLETKTGDRRRGETQGIAIDYPVRSCMEPAEL